MRRGFFTKMLSSSSLFILFIIPAVFSAQVVLFDSSSLTSDLNWQTFTTHKTGLQAGIGWYEESWPGMDRQSNVRIYASCSPEISKDSNGTSWVFVPPITTDRARGLYIELMFTIRECSKTGSVCKETVNVHVKEYDNVVSAAKFDPIRDFHVEDKNFGDVWKKHKVLTMSNADVDQTTFPMRLKPETKQIQIAFDDNGACTSLLVTRVYYTMCDAAHKDYTVFETTVSEAQGADENVMVQGKCVENAVPKNGVTPVAFCGQAGQWTKHVVGGCECLPGHEPAKVNGKRICRECPLGHYKESRGSSECLKCPQHSETILPGSVHCSCLPGYYRAPNETNLIPCTQPPNRPALLDAKFVNQTAVELRWEEPVNLGGRDDVWYEWECVRGDCSNIRAHPADKKLYSRVLKLSGLYPDSDYSFNVYAKNRVSAVAGEKMAAYRAIDVRTKPAAKSVVHHLRVEEEHKGDVRLVWDTENSAADQFEVEVSSSELGTIETRSTKVPIYSVTNLQTGVIYTFRVRAYTDSWTGWSSPLSYEAGKGIAVLVGTSTETELVNFWGQHTTIAMIAVVLALFVLLVIIFFMCRSNSRNRKQMSDLDALDTYKQDTMTPDYGSGHRSQFHDKLGVPHGKMNTPLIPFGTPVSQPPPYYGGAGGNTGPRFKPYVDPSTYDDPNQALNEFTLEIPPEAVYITQVIGGGEFGDVCMGTVRKAALDSRYAGFDEVETVAIKTLKPGSSPKAKMDFLLEASIMGQFAHPNVVRLIGVVTKAEPAMIVTEYMENGSLDHFLRDRDTRGVILGWPSIVDMLRGIAAGMKYLTDKGYVHRDLAARNVLVDSTLHCKIADFGLSRGMDVTTTDAEYTTSGGKIPVRWTAPEAITHRKFSAASDVWSYGVLMWEVCSFGERPYWDWTNQRVITEIMNDFRMPAPMNCPQSLHRLMLWCWKIERHDRPTFAQLLAVLEKYSRNPDLIYADATLTARTAQNAMQSASYMTQGRPHHAPPPPSGSPPIYPQLEDFLKSLGLGHTRDKLNTSGVNTVGELARRGHLDLLAIGLISEEYQRIRDALHQLQLPRGLSRPEGTLPRIGGPALRTEEGFFV